MQKFSAPGDVALPLPVAGNARRAGAVPTSGTARVADRLLVTLFCAAAFVGAGLVFLIEPMIVKMVLPKLGGSPAVWNTALLFFQAVLLVGYGYAHVTTRALPLRRQAVLHLAVLGLPLAFVPIALPGGWVPPDGGSPATWLIVVLGATVGVPYFVVTTASPLLQRWFSGTSHPLAHDPYFLYAAGNAGSLAGLLGYPLFVEPRFSLADQGRLWAVLYLVFAALTLASVIALRRSRPGLLPSTDAVPTAAALDAANVVRSAIDWRRRARWVVLGAVPSSLMMGATTYLSTDVAAVPLLWVVPLAVYLLTFILTFGRRNPVPVERATRYLPYFLAYVAVSTVVTIIVPLAVSVSVHVVTLFLAGMLCHGRLAADRPEADRLTEFFFLISLGGVIGGACNALLAPVLFNSISEYPIALVAVLLLRPAVTSSAVRMRLPQVVTALAVYGAVMAGSVVMPRAAFVAALVGVMVLRAHPRQIALALGGVLLVGVISREAGGLYRERTFFGALTVKEDARFVTLSHGTTVHGEQSRDPRTAGTPLTYYHPTGPLGQAFAAFRGDRRFDRVGLIGLGAGSIAAYAEPGQQFTYYEIDDAVVRIAENRRFFTFLSDTKGKVDVVLGDARLSLAKAADRSYGVLVLDAFSSDSIPVHLLTTDAMRLYVRKLGPNPLILIHVSNRYLELEPVVAAIARDVGLTARVFRDEAVPPALVHEGKTASRWVVLAGNPVDVQRLRGHGEWELLRTRAGVSAWTDDYSNILDVLRFR